MSTSLRTTTVQHFNPDVQDLSRGVKEIQEQLQNSVPPMVANIAPNNGKLVRGVQIKAGELATVGHAFGRHAKGYHIASQSEFGAVKQSATQGSPKDTLTLEADADMTVDLWVY